MGIRYVFKPEVGLVMVLWQGKITLNEWISHLGRFLPEPAQAGTRKHLTDLRFATLEGSFGEPDFSEALSVLGKHRDIFAGRMVAVVTNDEFDRARMFEQMSKPLGANIIVFNDLDPACLWLGVDRKLVDVEFRMMKAAIGEKSGK